MRSSRLFSGLIALFAALACSIPAISWAGTLQDLGDNGIVYSAPGEEANDVTISVLPPRRGGLDPRVEVSDAGAPIVVGKDCKLTSTGTSLPSTAVCDAYALGGIGVALGDGNDQLRFPGPANGLVSMAVFGGPGNDQIYGSPVSDDLHGGPGNDIINGEGGDDALRGNSGSDQLLGGAGNDNLQGDLGNDKSYGGLGNDQVGGDYSTGYGTYQGNDQLFGGSGNDTLGAWAGHNLLDGGPGDDTLWTKGHNRIDGGTGSNAIDLLPTYDRSQLACSGNDQLYWMVKPSHLPGKPPWATTGSGHFGTLWGYSRVTSC